MSEASDHDCAILLLDDIEAGASVASHYARMVSDYIALGDRSGLYYSLKNAQLHLRSAIQSFKDLDALNAPKPELRGVAE